jgi:1,4-dihydroxy-6-naphthoate synthase
MKLTLGFSPCPNDTFIFDALVNHKIDTEGFEFEVALEDVQQLNQLAKQDKLDISKISYGILPLLTNHYILLESGGALGKGVGPLLVAKTPIPVDQINNCRIAIPGENTTAHLLFSLAFPKARDKQFMIFSAIEDAVLEGKTNCGVIIHEGRFTYARKGLVKIMDLGEYWEQKTGCPIPLGGIVMRKTFGTDIHKKINTLIRKSLEYAFQHYPLLPDYVKQHSQEMEEEVMRQHIDLYVNNYSLQLGADGEKAVRTFLDVYAQINGQPVTAPDIFASSNPS